MGFDYFRTMYISVKKPFFEAGDGFVAAPKLPVKA